MLNQTLIWRNASELGKREFSWYSIKVLEEKDITGPQSSHKYESSLYRKNCGGLRRLLRDLILRIDRGQTHFAFSFEQNVERRWIFSKIAKIAPMSCNSCSRPREEALRNTDAFYDFLFPLSRHYIHFQEATRLGLKKYLLENVFRNNVPYAAFLSSHIA